MPEKADLADDQDGGVGQLLQGRHHAAAALLVQVLQHLPPTAEAASGSVVAQTHMCETRQPQSLDHSEATSIEAWCLVRLPSNLWMCCTAAHDRSCSFEDSKHGCDFSEQRPMQHLGLGRLQIGALVTRPKQSCRTTSFQHAPRPGQSDCSAGDPAAP